MRTTKFRTSAMMRAALAGFALALSIAAGTASARAVNNPPAAAAFGSVKSFRLLTPPYSWRVVDDRTLILWATPFRPYLLELAYPSPDLRFANVIGVTSSVGIVHSGFDAVRVRGLRYPIDRIYQLTPDEARTLKRHSSR